MKKIAFFTTDTIKIIYKARMSGGVPEDVDFAAVIRLLGTPDEDALKAARSVASDCSNGFLLVHMKSLLHLTERLCEIYKETPAYWVALADLARVASLPFVSQKQSDFSIFSKYIPPLLGALSQPLSLNLPADRPHDNYEQLRLEIAHMLSAWARFAIRPDVAYTKDGAQMMQEGTPNLRILYQSGVISDITKCFRYERCPEVVIILLGAFRDMSLYAPLAKQITNTGVLSNLLQIIRCNLLGSDILLLAAEVLWNVLELDWEGGAVALQHSIDAFYEFMRATLANGYRFKDKVFRNDMMVLLMYLSKYPPNRRPFAETGLLGLLLHAGAPDVYAKQIGAKIKDKEGGSGKECEAPPLSLTWNQEDNEFRLLLWKTAAKCCTDPLCLQIANEYFFIPTLLTFLDLTDQFAQTSNVRTAEQNKLLQLAALGALFVLFGEDGSRHEEAVNFFVDSQGPTILLRLLSGSEDEDLRLKTVRVLLKAVRCGCVLEVSSSMKVLVPLFHGNYPVALRQCACAVISLLCQVDPSYCSAFRRLGGVEAVIGQVKYEPENTMEHHLFLTLSVVDLVWSAVVGTRKNEKRFLSGGGLFNLLDILEIAPMVLKRQIIGCVADFIDSPDHYAGDLFLQWNSNVSSQSALRIVLEIWQHDQKAADALNEDGTIQNLEYPLNPRQEGVGLRDKRQRNFATGFLANSPLMSSNTMGRIGSALDLNRSKQINSLSMTGCGESSEEKRLVEAMKEDCRARIYAIVSKIGYEGHEALTTEELQAIEIIRMLPDCVVLEKWMEVQKSLVATGLKPIASDKDWIDKSIDEQKTKTAWIQSVQTQLMDQRYTEDYESLVNFYDDVRARCDKPDINGNTKSGTMRFAKNDTALIEAP